MDHQEILHKINREIEFEQMAKKTYFTLRGAHDFPESLRKWSDLETLEIEVFKGTYPNLSTLKSLKKLVIRGGEIGPIIATIPHLEILEVHGMIRGDLGKTLKACKQIKELVINELTLIPSLKNEIPKEVAELKHLRRLSLTGSKLENIPDISKLNQLEKLMIGNYAYPAVRGQLSESIGNCTNLKELRIKKALLEAPQWIGNLKKLQTLKLEDTELEVIPPGIEKCKNLGILDLGLNKFNSISPLLFELPKLKTLDLLSNPIKNLPTLSKISKIKELKLHNTEIQELPENLVKHCPNLESLDIGGNQLLDLPEQLKELKDLKHLKINYNYSLLKRPTVLDELKNTIIEEDGVGYMLKNEAREENNEEEWDEDQSCEEGEAKNHSYWIHGLLGDNKKISLKVESINWTEDYPHAKGDFWSINRQKKSLSKAESYQGEVMVYDCGYKRYWFKNELGGSTNKPIAQLEKKMGEYFYKRNFYKENKLWHEIPLKNKDDFELIEIKDCGDYDALVLKERLEKNKVKWLIKKHQNKNWSEEVYILPLGEELIYFEEEKKWGSYISPNSEKCLINPIKNLKRHHNYSGNQQIKVMGLNEKEIYMTILSTGIVSGNVAGILMTKNGGETWESLAISDTEIYNDLCYFESKVLVAAFNFESPGKGHVYEILRHKKTLLVYVKDEIEATFLTPNGSELLVGGGYSDRIYSIENNKIQGFYKLDFEKNKVEFEIYQEEKDRKEKLFDVKKTKEELKDLAKFFYETECWEEACDIYKHLYQKEKKIEYAEYIADCLSETMNYPEAFHWYEIADPKDEDPKNLIQRAYLSLDIEKKKTAGLIKQIEKNKGSEEEIALLKAEIEKDNVKKVKLYKEVLKHNPKNKKALKELGEIYLRNNNFREAKNYLDQYLLIYPRNIEILIQKLKAEEKLKDSSELSKTIEKLCLYDFLNVKWHEEKLKLHKKMKRPKEEIQKIQEMIYDLKDRASTYSFAKGWLDQNANFGHVENRLKEALHCFPDSADFLLLMTTLRTLQGDAKEAKKFCEKALKVDPQSPAGFFHRGVIATMEGDNFSAEKYYLKCIENDPSGIPMIYYNLGHIQDQKNNFKEAIRYYSQAIRELSKNFIHTAYNNRAYSFFKLGEYLQAERDVRKSLEINDENAAAWLTLAAILNKKPKSKKEGEACILKALELGFDKEEILKDEELGGLRRVIQ